MEILAGLTEGIISNALYDVVKRILKNDPIRSAIDQAFDELIQEKPNDFFVIEEIDRNRKHIFNNINLTEEATFVKILIDNNVLPETASRLYKKFSKKFKENIKEAALKEPEIFYSYAIREFENIKTDNKELIILLTGFAHKNEVYLERIIKHFKDLEKIPNIPDIQLSLRKGEISEGEFFRKEPIWVDFRQGFLVERMEVDEIIKRLATERIQLVFGAPASGKSIILKNIGYNLANIGKNVYVVELKKHTIDEVKIFFENIPTIDDESIFIVDDAHLHISECERLIRDFRNKGKGNLLIGSRETEEIKKGDPTIASEFEYLSKTAIHIQAEDVTEELIQTFLREKHNLSDERIKSVSGNLEKFKNDLWHLSWALKAYKHDKDTVEDDTIYEMIKERIKITKAEDIFLPLSVFYRYEIPIERKFLEKQLGIKKETIEQLIGFSEIEKTEEKGKPIMISLNHSSIAKLYFGTYQNYPSLGEEIKEKLLNGKDEEELEYCFFYRYCTTTDSRNAVDVIIYLGIYGRKENGGLTLIKRLVEENKIQEIIQKGIEKEKNIEKIGVCIERINMMSIITGWKLVNKNISTLLAKMEEEENIEKIGIFLARIDINGTVTNRINIPSLILKIEKEDNLVKIVECIGYIAGTGKEVVLKLVDIVSAKIEKEEDIAKINSYIITIRNRIVHRSSVEKELLSELVNRFDNDTLSEKIEKEEDILEIGQFVWTIAEASKKVGLKLVESINIDTLSSKINKEEDIEKIWECMFYIAKVSEEVELKLADSIDINILSAKIEQEGNIEKIGTCVGKIAEKNKEVGLKLVNTISAKIEKEDDVTKIGEYAIELARRNNEMGLKLVNNIDIEILLSKIEKEEDIKAVGMCVANIGYGNKEKEKEIINHLNPKIRKEIEKMLPSLERHVKLMAMRL